MVKHRGTIVVTGRGGTGKSTFTALLSRYLGERGVEPILLVDSDPDESLAEMIGIDLEKHNKRSIADVLSEILETRKMATMSGMTPTDKIEPYLWQESLYEGKSFYDFIGIGTKWIEGCYCLPDRSLGRIMDMWGTNYEFVVVDSPAGVEHLNRRITKKVKDVFNILGPSKKSFDNAARSFKIMKEVDIDFDNYYLVGGYRFQEKLEKEAEKQPFQFLGRVESDPRITEYNIEGKSLFDLPSNSPAYQSVKKILQKVGY
jgi:CO dehydrogenase maturation factor